MSDRDVTPCGGCGETNPETRCLGCFHVFIPGTWPDRPSRLVMPTDDDVTDSFAEHG